MGWPDPQRSGVRPHNRHDCGYAQCSGTYGPCCYPDSHPGWSFLIGEVADAFLPSRATRRSDDHGHIPLRWRLLVHYRDTGASLADIARLFNVTPQSVSQQYSFWKPRLCCPLDEQAAA